jgi:hypothetical protein
MRPRELVRFLDVLRSWSPSERPLGMDKSQSAGWSAEESPRATGPIGGLSRWLVSENLLH